MPKIEYHCHKCGKVFLDYKCSNRKFCSRKCSGGSYNKPPYIPRRRLTCKGGNWGPEPCRVCGLIHPIHGDATPEMREFQSKLAKKKHKEGILSVETLHSPESKEKRLITMRTPEVKEKLSILKSTPEEVERQSKVMKDFWNDPDKREKTIDNMIVAQNRPETIEKRKNGLKKAWAEGRYDNAFKSPTSIETKLWGFLDSRNIPYEKQYKIDIGYKTRYVDAFILPNICIEADGEFWHGEDVFGNNRKEEDERDDEALRKLGYIIYRISGVDFKNKKYIEILNTIITAHRLNQKP